MSRWAEAPQSREQLVLFPERLDEAVPPNHAVRLLDELLRRIDWSDWEAKYHVRLGQPAYHPRVLASVLLYGLLTRLRSSRGLEEALLVRLDFRWLAEGRSIDHTTLSEFRRKHPAELRQLFVQVVQIARDLGVVSLARLGFDGTRVRANNRRSGTRTLAELQAERQELAAKFDEHARQADAEDARDEELFGTQAAHELPAELRDQAERQRHLDATLAELQRLQDEGTPPPQRIPCTDLESRVMPNKEGGHAPNYTPVATVDIASGLIVGADVLSAINEDHQLLPQVEQVQRDFGVPPTAVLVDGLIGTGANLAACAELGIEVYSPCATPTAASNPALRDDPTQPVPEADWERLPTHPVRVEGKPATQLDKRAFVYDQQRDCYWCPLGQPLGYVGTTTEKARSGPRLRRRYKAAATACAGCPLRARCLQGRAAARQINREQHEVHRERQAAKMATPEAQAIYALRRHPGERPFAVIKQQFGLRQFLLRGLRRVQMEWQWAATAFNLGRLLSLVSRSRDGPEPGACPINP
jgi:transposase